MQWLRLYWSFVGNTSCNIKLVIGNFYKYVDFYFHLEVLWILLRLAYTYWYFANECMITQGLLPNVTVTRHFSTRSSLCYLRNLRLEFGLTYTTHLPSDWLQEFRPAFITNIRLISLHNAQYLKHSHIFPLHIQIIIPLFSHCRISTVQPEPGEHKPKATIYCSILETYNVQTFLFFPFNNSYFS